MIHNYLITALRAFKMQKQHFLLNLFGLSMGLAAAILVALFVKNELSYDSQHPDADRVYRIAQDYSKMGLAVIPIFNYARGLQTLEYNQVEDMFAITMVDQDPNSTVMTDVKLNGQGYKLDGLFGATANIANFISIETLHGNMERALNTPTGLALSYSEAMRIFGKTDVIGQTLEHAKGQFTVYAVFADLPDNTHFAFKSLAYIKQDPNNIHMHNNYVYIKLANNTNITDLAENMTDKFYNGPARGQISIQLHSLLNLHLDAKSPFEMKTGGTQQAVNICIGLSVLLILIAVFNFINMSIAQSTKRAKEVGVRKALGASKPQLVTQFLSESVMVSLFAMLVASFLVELLLPSFNTLVDRALVIDYASIYSAILVAGAVIVGILAGLYPALFISSFSAKRVLSGDLQRGSTAIFVRKSLLTLQASLSVALIIAAVTLQQQLNYLQSLPLGYDKTHRLVISQLPQNIILTKQSSALLDKINTIDGVVQTTVIDTELTSAINASVIPTWPNGESSEGVIPFVGTGFGVVEGLGLELLAGRDFSATFASDWASRKDNTTYVGAIITASVARQAGYTDYEQIIGKTITDKGRGMRMRVVGVVDDVKVGNMKEAYSSIFFLAGMTYAPTANVIVTIDSSNVSYIKEQVLQLLAKEHKIYEPKIALLSDNYQTLLRSDQRITEMVFIFSSLAVILTMLGTFGLASFAALRRQKEVAVRKVLGASRISLVNLLAKEFLVLVGVSIAIAYPVTYWVIAEWLANFNDRVEQLWWVYVSAALLVAGITWLTVASLAFKAASARPSLILRYE